MGPGELFKPIVRARIYLYPFLYFCKGYGIRHAEFFEAERARRLRLITPKCQGALYVYSK